MHDIRQARALLADHKPKYVIADKAYDSDQFVRHIESRGSTTVIPNQSGRGVKRPLLQQQYRRRNLAERCVNALKHYRRIATRYEKTARNFLAFIQFAATLFWLE